MHSENDEATRTRTLAVWMVDTNDTAPSLLTRVRSSRAMYLALCGVMLAIGNTIGQWVAPIIQ